MVWDPVVDEEDARGDQKTHVTGDFPAVDSLALVVAVDKGSVQRENGERYRPDCLLRINRETTKDTSHAETKDLICKGKDNGEAKVGPSLVEEDWKTHDQQACEVANRRSAGEDDGREKLFFRRPRAGVESIARATDGEAPVGEDKSHSTAHGNEKQLDDRIRDRDAGLTGTKDC